MQTNHAAARDLVRMRSLGGGSVAGSALLVGTPLVIFLTGHSGSHDRTAGLLGVAERSLISLLE
jgi:hypothetical protein